MDDVKVTLIERMDLNAGEEIPLSKLPVGEYRLRVKYEGKNGEYRWDRLFPDEIPGVLGSIGNNIEKIFVCPLNSAGRSA